MSTSTMTETPMFSCPKEGCTFDTDGACLEDFEPVKDCPSLIILPEDNEDTKIHEVVAPSPLPDSEIGLSHGEQLSLSEAGLAIGSRAMSVISIIGDHRAGKTTLLATLIQKFMGGPYAGCAFAGTLTPRGFDRRCHDSTVRSNRKVPETPRTPRGLHFLHLAMLQEATASRFELLLADRAGEEYEELRQSDDVLGEFVEIKRSDIILLLVDGEKLSGTLTRGSERHKASLTIGALEQGGLLPVNVLLLVVMTKIDLLPNDEDERGAALQAFDDIVERLKASHSKVIRVMPFKVAARSATGSLELGHGLEALIEHMLSELSSDRDQLDEAPPLDPTLMSAYDLFGLTVTGYSP